MTSSKEPKIAAALKTAGVNEIYGVTTMNERPDKWRYFLEFEPVATAAYAIYIYHITPDQANRVRRKLGLPELPEEGRFAQNPS